MTCDRDTTDRAAKRKRRIAGVLVVIWAGSWTLSALCWLVGIASITTIDYVPVPSLGESMKEAWDLVGAFFPLVAASLVFVGWLPIPLMWWRSRRPETPLDRIVLGGLGGLLGGLMLLVFGASIADRSTQAELERQAVDATATALGDYVARSQNMELVGHVNSGDSADWFVASDLSVQGEYAYIVGGITGFHVVDVSNRGEPVEVGSYAMPGQLDFLSVYVSGSYAYVAADPVWRPVDVSSGLRVVDVSNPASPFEVGSCATPDAAASVFVSGSYAYVAADTSGMRVVDVSNPASPYEVSFYDTPGRAFDVYVSGSYAYVADWDGGLRVLDVSNPGSPFEVGSYATPDTAGSVFVSGSHAYVTTGSSGLRAIDVSNPAAPKEVGSYTLDSALAVYVSGSHAYVTTGSSGLRVIDVSNPAAPKEVGSYTPQFAVNVYVSGPYAYLAARHEGLFILRMLKD